MSIAGPTVPVTGVSGSWFTAGRPAAATAIALTMTLGLAAGSWVVTVREMSGMTMMGVATPLGSWAPFLGVWVPMMAAMMLPGAAPAVIRRAHASGHVTGQLLAAAGFIGAYLAVWAAVGVAVRALYQPHTSDAAAGAVLAAGVYELTPLKRHFRRRCRESAGSGWRFGLCCVGSSIGLMLILVAVSVMSIAWMSVIAVLIVAQKLAPATGVVDVGFAVAIVGLALVIAIAPASVPGLIPPM